MTERPTPDLTILETRVYRGANIWSYEQAIHLVVDLGRLEDHPTNTLPGFTEHLLEMLPGLQHHSCSRGRRGGFVEPGAADTLDAGQVHPGPRPSQAGAAQDLAHRPGLVQAVLDQQQATGGQVRWRPRGDRLDRAQPVGAVGERLARLVAQVALAQMRIGCGDVGRVRHDQLEA